MITDDLGDNFAYGFLAPVLGYVIFLLIMKACLDLRDILRKRKK